MMSRIPDKTRFRVENLSVKARKLIKVDNSVSTLVLLVLPVLVIAVPMFVFGSFVIGRHATAYIAGGVPREEAYSGSIVAQVLIAVVWTVAMVFYRRGHVRWLRTGGGFAGGLALLFVLLPNLVSGQSWLTVVLSTMTTLLFDVLFGAVLAGVVLLMPPSLNVAASTSPVAPDNSHRRRRMRGPLL